jgi:hypothetical protein
MSASPCCRTAATVQPVLAIVYDLRDPGAWDAARRHRRLWGQLYVDVHHLGEDAIVVLSFRPAPDPRWRDWEATRLEWILDELGDPA